MQPDGGAARQQVEPVAPVAMTRPADLAILDSQASDTKTLVSADVDVGCCQSPPPSSPLPRQITKKKYRRRSIAPRARALTGTKGRIRRHATGSHHDAQSGDRSLSQQSRSRGAAFNARLVRAGAMARLR